MNLINRKKILNNLLQRAKAKKSNKEYLFLFEDKEDKGVNGEPYYNNNTGIYYTEKEVDEFSEDYKVIIFKTIYPEDFEEETREANLQPSHKPIK